MKKTLLLLGASVAAVVIVWRVFSPAPTTETPPQTPTPDLSFKKLIQPPTKEHSQQLKDKENTTVEVDALLKNLLDAAQPGNGHEGPGAVEKLNAYLAQHPEAIAQVLEAFRNQNDAQALALFTEVLRRYSNDDGRKLITRTALEITAHDSSPRKRQIAVDLLSAAAPVADGALPVVAEISRTDADLLTRIHAVDTMKAWAGDPEVKAQVISEMGKTLEKSTEPKLSGEILEIMAQQNSPMPENIVKAAAQNLTLTNANFQVAAIMTLGEAAPENKDYALQQLQTAYRQETNVEVKKNILPQIVRLAQSDAVPILQQLANDSTDPLASDIVDYSKIAAAGQTVSIDEIYSQKFAMEGQRN